MQIKDIREQYLKLGDDAESPWEQATKSVSRWKEATRNAFKEIRNSNEELLAAINASVDMSSVSGKQNYNDLQAWNETSKRGGNVASAYEKADDQLKQYLDTCKSGEATWDGFVKHQQIAAKSLEATTIGAKAAAVGMKVLKAAMSMIVVAIAQFAIQKLVEGIDYLIHMQDKLNEKAKEARKQYEETTSELESQEEALEKVQSRLAELSALDAPTLADKKETEELKAQNKELELQIAYYKEKQKVEEEEALKAEKKAWNVFTGNGSEAGGVEGFAVQMATNSASTEVARQNSVRQIFGMEETSVALSEYDQLIKKKEQLAEKQKELNELYSKGYSAEKIAEEKIRLDGEISDLKAEISEGIEPYLDSKLPEAQKFVEEMQFAILSTDKKAEILRSRLADIKVNESAIANVERIARFVDDKGNSASMEDFEKALHKAIPDEDDYNAFIEFAGGIDAVAASFATTTSATDDYAATVSEMQDLADLGEFFGNIGDDAKESITNLINLTGDEFRNQFEEKFGGLSDEAQEIISSIFKIDDKDFGVDQMFDFLGAIGEISQAFVDESADISKRYSEAADGLTEAFGKSIDGVSGNIDSVKELSAAMSAVKTTYDDLTAAMDEQNNTGSISIQTYLSLIEKNADYAKVLKVDETGAIHLADDARKTMVMTQIAAIQKSIEEEIELKRSQLAMYKFRGTLSVLSQAIFDDAIKPSVKFAAILDVLKQALAQIKAGKFTTVNFSNMFEQTVNDMLKKAGKDSSSYNNKYTETMTSLQNEIKSLEESKATVGRIQTDYDFNKYYTSPSSKSSGSSSSSSSDDPRLKAWKEMLAVKKHQLEMDQITEEQYYAWLEANYKKQLNNQKKYAEEWRQYEEDIYKWKKQKRLDDWNEAVELKKYELEMGKIDEGEYYAWLAANYKNYLNDKTKYAEEWRDTQKDIHDFEEQQAKDSQDALEDLIDLRVDMLKQEKNNEKDVLKERQDNIKDFYDKQRDLLKEHYDQIDKEEQRREKRKKVTDIQAELLELEADDSVEAQKRRLELEEDLSDAKKDLNDFERDEELDQAEKMYDDLEEMQTEYYDRQIEAIEDYLDNAYELRQQAIKDLQNGNAQLYQEMIEYNREYGDGIDRSITAKWEAAYEALYRYNGLLDEDYDMKLANMTGYSKGRYETAAEREAREAKEAEARRKNAKTVTNAVNNVSKNTGSSGSSAKSGPNVGDKVTVKKSATHFSPQSGSAKMNKSVPGSTYIVYQTKGNQVLIGLSGKRYTGWVYKSDLQGYAKGTSNAKGGLSVVNEEGLEYILGNPSKGKYQFLNSGDKVFNAKASEFLYKWANEPAKILGSMAKSLSASSVAIASPCNITVGDININGSADEKTVGELRRVRKELVTDILNEFKKMKK